MSDRGHIRVLKETIDVLETYAPDFEASKNSMLLVVTKGANDKNYGDPGDEADDSRYFKAKVAGKSGILNELDKELSGYQKAFLTFIHTADRFTYSFKADIKKDTPVSTVERERIIQKIQELGSTSNNNISGIKISDHAKLRSGELAEHIKTCLAGLHKKIAETAFKSIADFCSQKVAACEDLFDQDLAALQAMLKNFQKAVIPLVTKQYDTAEVFFENLQTLLTNNDIPIAGDSLQAIHALLGDIKSHESAQLLFRKICDANIENTQLRFTEGLIPLSQTLKSLIQTCVSLQDYQPIKPGSPYMEKFADEAENTVKVEMLLKHAQDHEKLGHFQDAEEAYGKLLKYTERSEHYKLYAGCLKEIYLQLSSALPKDEAKEKAYQEKASRAFYYLGELHLKKGQREDAKNAYKASCDLALHEAALQALIHVARRLEDAAEVAAALEKLAAFYEQKGKLPSAIESLEDAFKVLPSVPLLERLAELYGQEGGKDSQHKVDKTRILRFELEISQDPKNIEAYRDYGWFLKSIGKHNEARAVKKRIDVQLQAIQRELFQGLQENLQALQQKAQTLEQKVVKQKTKIGGLKQTIHSQAGKLETLEKQVQGSAIGSNVAIDNLQKRVEAFEKEVLPEQINRLNALETVQLSEQAKSIRTLNTQLETLKGQVQTNATKNDTAHTALQTRLANFETVKLPEQAKSIRTLNTQLANLAKQVQSNATGTHTAINDLQKNLLAVKTVQLPEQAESIRTLNTQLANLAKQVQSNFNKRVELLEQKVLYLDFSKQRGIQDADLISVLKKNPYVKVLKLEGCSNISDASLRHLASLTQLTSLNLGGYRSRPPKLELGYFPLATFDSTPEPRQNYQLTDGGLAHLAGLISIPELRQNYQLTDGGLAHLAGLTQLKKLYLINCTQLTDGGFRHLRGLTQLSTLDLSGCQQLTDGGLAHLAGLKQLKELELSGCQRLTGAGLEHLTGLTQLSTLDLSGCQQLTDGGLAHLAGLTQLSSLYLRGCSQLTNVGLKYLRRLTQLKELNLVGCRQISPQARADLKQKIPGLNIKIED